MPGAFNYSLVHQMNASSAITVMAIQYREIHRRRRFSNVRKERKKPRLFPNRR